MIVSIQLSKAGGRAAARQMKTLALIALAMLVAACGGDATGPAVLTGGTMSATVDGAAWTANTSVGAARNGQFIGLAGVSGMGGSQTTISMGFPDALGTFTATTAVGINANFSVAGTGALWQALGIGAIVGSITVTVTELTAERVRGTFSFTAPPVASTVATGTKTVTSGSFDARFQ
jgi:hypothetical protein